MRELKSQKADPPVVKEAVDSLLTLKGKYKTLTGEDVPAPARAVRESRKGDKAAASKGKEVKQKEVKKKEVKAKPAQVQGASQQMLFTHFSFLLISLTRFGSCLAKSSAPAISLNLLCSSSMFSSF